MSGPAGDGGASGPASDGGASGPVSEPGGDGEQGELVDVALRDLVGTLAGGAAAQLAVPLRQLRENLAVLVETLDRYVGSAQGPTPYPWRSLQALRQDLADAYLLSREVSRTTSDLAACVGPQGRAAARVDINESVEAALNLVRHRVSANTEIFVDLEDVPPVRAVPAELVLALAGQLLVCVESARSVDGSAISIRTRAERAADRAAIVVYIADNGGGAPLPPATAALIRRVTAAMGAAFDGTSEPGHGSVFEWRIPCENDDLG